MKFLITGGCGFIGSNLAEELLKQGHSVTVIDNLSTGNIKNISSFASHPNFTFHKTDIRNDLDELFKSNAFGAVFHLAARARVPYSIEHPKETHDINATGTLNVLDHARRHGVKRFVFSSSGSVYGNQTKIPFTEDMHPNPLSPYALHKFIGEQYCRQYAMHYGMQTVALRYFNVYGRRMDLEGAYALLIAKCMYNFIKGEPITIYGDGTRTRDFTYVGDIVRGNILAATTNNPEAFGQVFNTGAGNNKSVNFVVSTIRGLVGKGETVTAPPRVEPEHHLADFSKAKRVIGWEPQMRFEEGIKVVYEDFKERYA
jgi:UDP-glucose 4-epimerase